MRNFLKGKHCWFLDFFKFGIKKKNNVVHLFKRHKRRRKYEYLHLKPLMLLNTSSLSLDRILNFPDKPFFRK